MLATDEIRQNERIQRCLRTDDGKELINKLLNFCFKTTNQLKTARDEVDIHRYQGRLEAYEQILKMKED